MSEARPREKCSTEELLHEKAVRLRGLAKLIAEHYLKEEEKYSVVDRLATSVNPEGVKLALYELLRGIRQVTGVEDIDIENVIKVVNGILRDLDIKECLEHALSTAKSIAVLALSEALRYKKSAGR